MTTSIWGDLAITSLKDPANAAERLMAAGLPRDVLWTALALISVLSTILFAISNLSQTGTIYHPVLTISPFFYFLIVAAGMVFSIYALFWAGRFLNGTGSLGDMMVLVVWLHALHLGALYAIFAISLAVPALATMMALVEAFLVIYVMLHFINAGHRLGSLWRAFGVLLVMSAIAIAFTALISTFGISIVGASANA